MPRVGLSKRRLEELVLAKRRIVRHARQAEILELVSQGMKSEELGREFNVTPRNVRYFLEGRRRAPLPPDWACGCGHRWVGKSHRRMGRPVKCPGCDLAGRVMRLGVGSCI